MEIVIAVMDFYKNIPGKGKVKELTKNKSYEAKVKSYYSKKSIFITTDLGEVKMYSRRNMFISKEKSRKQKIEQLLK